MLMVGISIYAYVPKIIAEVKNPVASFFNTSLWDEHPPDFDKARISGARTRRVRVNDSISLSLYRIPAATKVHGTILALHGYRSSKNRFLPVARFFTENGWDFVAVDLRAHNQSTGQLTGFSCYERRDIATLIDSLRASDWIRGPLVIYGHSIGAATAVYVAAEHAGVDGLILESAFDEFGNLLPNYWNFYVTEQTEIPQEVAGHFFEMARIPVDSIRPVEVAPRIRIPVLQIQGDADPKVRPAQARRLFDSLGSGQKQWISIPGGTHNKLWLPDTTTYFQRILMFLDTLPSPKKQV